MKNNLGSTLLAALAIGALSIAIALNPPGGVRWIEFLLEPVSWLQKADYFAGAYLLPALSSFCAIALFQLQFRLSSSGANKRTVFSVCVLASGAMLMGLRAIASSSNSGPSYVVGMALGYTVMSRLYAIRMRTFLNRVSVPWPIWRGNPLAVREIDQAVRARSQRAA
jgi:hypothetical protein